MKRCFLLFLLFLITLPGFCFQEDQDYHFKPGDIEVEIPLAIIEGIPVNIELVLREDIKASFSNDTISFTINGEEKKLVFADGVASSEVVFDRAEPLGIRKDNFAYVKSIEPIPLWLSIIPPLLAIFMALLFREVMISLFTGILVGAVILSWQLDGWFALLKGFFLVIDKFILSALYDWGHLSIITFSTLIGGLVAVISKNGGTLGIVNRISKFANSAKNGQLVTWFMGVAIFFDDYANTLIVGNTMRPLTDKLQISREKLSYVVDSTAAPIAAIAFVTTWIGAELGYIQDGIDHINAFIGGEFWRSPYAIFLNSLKYSFYPIFAILFILILIFQKRDFGSMHTAEIRARSGGGVSGDTPQDSGDNHEAESLTPREGVVAKAYNAIVPIFVLVIITLAGLLVTGWDPSIWNNNELGLIRKLSTIIGGADSYKALLWASMSGLVIAIFMSVSQRILNLEEAVSTAISGFKTMMSAVTILILAWSLAAVTEEMHTAQFLTQLFSDTVPLWFIPAITFVLSALVAFSTGTSWGTMAIIYPLMIPLTYQLGISAGLDHEAILIIFYNMIASVLAGAVLGDHCSPISDTTILSSLASGCNHIDHVRTQLPYALTVGLVALFVGIIPGSLGVSSWITIPSGIFILICIVRFFGKPVPETNRIVSK